MRLFSIRNMLGAAAIYGGWKYSQSHGGVKQSINGLLGKIREAAELKESQAIGLGRSRGGVSGAEVGSSIGAGLGTTSDVGADLGSDVGSNVPGSTVESRNLGGFGSGYTRGTDRGRQG